MSNSEGNSQAGVKFGFILGLACGLILMDLVFLLFSTALLERIQGTFGFLGLMIVIVCVSKAKRRSVRADEDRS